MANTGTRARAAMPKMAPQLVTLAVLDSGEFLEGVRALGHDARAYANRVRHLGHIDVAAAVDPDAVRRPEIGRDSCIGTTPAQQHVAVDVVNAQPRRLFLLDRSTAERRPACTRHQLADVHALVFVDEDVLRPLHVVPLGLVRAVGTKDLDPIVFAIAYEDAAVGMHPQAVRHTELARARPWLAE